MSDAGKPSLDKQGDLRLDKWLWFARFVKSRSLATRLVSDGNMRINGAPTQKAHYAVKIGDVLTFALGPHVRVIKIAALGERRGPAPEARLLYEDLDPPAPRPPSSPATDFEARDAGAGRPTKRDRRQTAALKSPRG
ncbi:MAG TPA: RNA-binding S4 domain-containing protein [Dongiaceae bacterium]|nr:RNA-binding S4 domain-containing protein [Dongiaceae bacterium]